MHGMGDCLHQRAVLRQILREHTVTLETSWASMYHDLIGEGLTLVRRPVGLRTQSKNQNREAHLFGDKQPKFDRAMRISYGGAQVLRTKSGTVLEAMCNVAGVSYSEADYRLPVPEVWTAALQRLPWWRAYAAQDKPLCVYRPLVARPEWKGSIRRNADPESYATLFNSIRHGFFVVSVADLEPAREWIIGPELAADVALHKGELSFELLAALFKEASLVYTSSGFAAILAPAVGASCVNVVGGYEHSGAHASGLKFAPMIAFGPQPPCTCFSSQCHKPCQIAIDVEAALPQLREFVLHNAKGLWTLEAPAPIRAAPLALPDPSLPPTHPLHQALLRQMRAAAWAKGHTA